MEQDNLTNKQKDYAIFLPALSGFYATFIGKQRENNDYVDPARFPQGMTDMEQLNWLNAQKGLFTYKWSLYSAGHANLDPTKQDWSEDMIRNRDRSNSWLLGDSGGFQIGKGVWEGDWRDPTSQEVKDELISLAGDPDKTIEFQEFNKRLAAANSKRSQVLNWMDTYMDYGMCLDIPSWVFLTPKGPEKTGIRSFQDALDGTRFNNDYFIKNRNGKCKFLNVLQGKNHKQAEDWYQGVKEYCDPKKYPNNHFNGWAMGGQNMSDVHLILKRIVTLINDGLLEKGIHDQMHFLGISKLELSLLLTDIQRAVRKYHNPNFTITFDCASPFLATANGQIYYNLDRKDGGRWSYQMTKSVDDKQYASGINSALSFKKIFENETKKKNYKFFNSPISNLWQIKDICIYKSGDLNKIGKEGKTSWDSFSYALQMSHNVWSHIDAVQSSNQRYYNEGNSIGETGKEITLNGNITIKPIGRKDGRRFPDMLDMCSISKTALKISRGDEKLKIKSYDTLTELIDDIIKTACTDENKALENIDFHANIWDHLTTCDNDDSFVQETARHIIDAHKNHWRAIKIGRIKGKKQYTADTQFEELFGADDIDLDDILNDQEAIDRLEKLEAGEILDKKGTDLADTGLFNFGV